MQTQTIQPSNINGASVTRDANPGTLMQASNQWASRPADQRFLNLRDMSAYMRSVRDNSKASVISTRDIAAAPVEESRDGLMVLTRRGEITTPTHFSFGQVARLAGAPAGYLRNLNPMLAADCINYGLKARDVEEIGILTLSDGSRVSRLSAATGPNYGRIWNHSIVDALLRRFGDGSGRDGISHFKVPGEFGEQVEITKDNTTLYASDRDMFVFLADEHNRIEIPGETRRDGTPFNLARGFFVWNSEVGDKTFGIAAFLFDYVCMNRIVWGAKQFEQLTIRHTSGAPHRFIEQVAPALERYAESATGGIVQAITDARAARFDAAKGDLDEFLGKRFTRSEVGAIKAAHLADEGRPIESIWDAVTGATAYARSIPFTDDRVAIERKAGAMLDAA